VNRNTYLLVALLAIGFGTFSNYAMLGSSGSGSGSRAYIPSGSGYSGGYSGGHK